MVQMRVRPYRVHMSPSEVADPHRVYLLVSSPDAAGGIARASANLANRLVETRQVEIIGLRRLGQGRRYPLDPRVGVRHASDLVNPFNRWMQLLPSRLAGFSRAQGHSALSDLMLRRILQTLHPGIVISTRPALHLASVRYAPNHCIKIGQDHVNLDFRVRNSSLSLIRRAIDGLDHFVVLTEADAAGYREAFPAAAERVSVIRNAAPWPITNSERTRRKVVVGAGQLGVRKGFDRLIEAYAWVAHQRPEWRLHIYGSGPLRDELAQLISDLGLDDQVVLKGRVAALDRVLEEASVFALTSRNEGFPMVLIEAMTKGVPIVSFDCPRGPAEIVVDGETGFLVADGDGTGLTSALVKVMDDDELRARMSVRTRQEAEQYQPKHILRAWTDLFRHLTEERAIPREASRAVERDA